MGSNKNKKEKIGEYTVLENPLDGHIVTEHFSDGSQTTHRK